MLFEFRYREEIFDIFSRPAIVSTGLDDQSQTRSKK